MWMKKGSSARVVLDIQSTIPNTNVAVYVLLEARARCEFTCIQLVSPDVGCSILQHVTLREGAEMSSHHASLGGSKSVHEAVTFLEGRNARSDISWVAYAKGKEDHYLSASNVFQAEGGRGEITMKGVAQGSAHITCKGMIAIDTKGQGTDTYLTQDVLMLDSTAKVDAVPGLEIKTNDVKASHSATVSRVTEEDLFYFAARGIDVSLAKRMYVEGFLEDLTGRIADATVREVIAEQVLKKYEMIEK